MTFGGTIISHWQINKSGVGIITVISAGNIIRIKAQSCILHNSHTIARTLGRRLK